jgi:hypothetical protein
LFLTKHFCVVEFHHHDRKHGKPDALIAGKIRAFAKWWLDLIRNVTVVAVLQYVARKSDKLAVKIIAEVSFPTLVVAQSVFLYQEQARSTPAGHGLWRRPWLDGHWFGH